jgi:ubiquinone biosynthesis protein
MIRALRSFVRLTVIARSLARHDALFLLDLHPTGALASRIARTLFRRRPESAGLRPGQRLALALTELGPTFIKFGQALSTRADLLGAEVTTDLAELQDRLPPFPAKAARAVIEADFGVPVEALFSAFDDAPVAAASIAQVHFAVTADGREVAVKVLRPDVKAKFAKDFEVMVWMAEELERWAPRLRRLKPVEVMATFAETVRQEMDLRLEAAAAQELAENFAGNARFRVPAVDWQRTSERVLTLERVGGARVDDPAGVRALGLDPAAVVRTAAEAFFTMVFRHGFFHADMHPGNLFVGADGTIYALDFGIMGRIDAATQRTLGEMLLGFLSRDYMRVAEVHVQAGYVPPHKSVPAFAQACRSIAEPILGKPIAEISIARLLGQLFHITEAFEMQTQPQLLLLQKSMLLAEGVGRRLAPETNMWEMARPLIEAWFRERLGPEARLIDTVGGVIESAGRLPSLIERLDGLAASLERGGVRLHPASARALRGEPRGRSWLVWLPWLLVLGLSAALWFR